MSYHHYYDWDFLKHLSEVNPDTAKRLQALRESSQNEIQRIRGAYREALAVEFSKNRELVRKILRPCHRKDVDEGKDLYVYSTIG